mgnify:CR=1 FL=1
MSPKPLDLLRAELGPAAARLPTEISQVPDEALNAFVESLRAAKKQQKQLLEQSAEHSLRLVPALLRPVVRKVLFG